MIKQGDGILVAPGNYRQAYSHIELDLNAYSHATVLIKVQVGEGKSAASFDLFPGNVEPPTMGRPVNALRISARPKQYDVPPGTCVTLAYTISSPQTIILGITGNWSSPAGSTNTYQYAVYVQPASPGSATVQPPRPGSVSIYDSPAVPDLGGHSILGGLLTGKGLTAILPNLKVCARPKNARRASQVCTEVCKPGHQCLNQPFPGVIPHAATLEVDVFDVDRPGSEHHIVTFAKNSGDCNSQQPCEIKVPDEATYGKDAVVKISFNLGSAYTCTADRGPGGPRKGPVTFDGGTILNTEYTDQVQVRAPVTVTGSDKDTGVVYASALSGIMVTVKNPNAQFIQFFSRERIKSDGRTRLAGEFAQWSPEIRYNTSDGVIYNNQSYTSVKDDNANHSPELSTRSAAANVWWYLDPTRGCDANPSACYDLTSDPKYPNWRLDAHAPFAPYYTPVDIVYGCGGVTLYDTPYILMGSGPETWRFTANDYVIIDQRVVWRVQWVKEKGPRDSVARYVSATVEPNSGAVLLQLKTLLQQNHLPIQLLP